MKTLLSTLVLALGLVMGLAQASFAEQAFTENGMHTQDWFAQDSFLELQDDFEVAQEEGKRLLVFFEQKGCIYCKRMHEEVLSHPGIAKMIQDNFRVVQLDLWGPRMVTDFDGEEMEEKDLARKWRANYTPGIFFFPTEIAEDNEESGKDLWVHRMDGAFGKITFTATFEWVMKDLMETQNLQRYVMERMPDIRKMLEETANS